MNFSMKIYINFRKFESFHSKKNFNLAKIVRMVESVFREKNGEGKEASRDRRWNVNYFDRISLMEEKEELQDGRVSGFREISRPLTG